MAGRITERADKFAQRYKAEEPKEVTQAEKETAFANDFMTPKGIREQWKQLQDKKDSYAR